MTRTIWPLLAAASLAACGSGGSAPVAGVSADEAAQLNNAAEMLDGDDGAANSAANIAE